MTDQLLQQAGTDAESDRRSRFFEALNGFISSQPGDTVAERVAAAGKRMDAARSTVFSWLGDRVAKNDYRKGKIKRAVFPDADMLTKFCEAADVSLEWLLTGWGPKSRHELRGGGTSSSQELERAVAIHLASAVSDVAEIPGWPGALYVDGRNALEHLREVARTESSRLVEALEMFRTAHEADDAITNAEKSMTRKAFRAIAPGVEGLRKALRPLMANENRRLSNEDANDIVLTLTQAAMQRRSKGKRGFPMSPIPPWRVRVQGAEPKA